MKVRAAARQDRTWHLMFGAFLLALCLLPFRAHAGETGSTDEYAGVPITNSVLLDPFDPVPTIQFRHGYDWDHCYDLDCGGYRHCREDCRWHGWYCPHDCYDIHRTHPGALNLGWWRCADECRHGEWWCVHDCELEGWHCEHDCYVHEPCIRDCRAREPFPVEGDRCLDICYGHLVHEYEERLAHHDEEAHRYDEQSHWYFEHVIEDHRGFFGRLFDFGRHDGPPPIPPAPLGPPPGPPGAGYGPPPGPPPGAGGYGPPPGPGGYGPPPGGPDHGGYGPGPGYDPGPGGYNGPPPGAGGYGPPGPPPSAGGYGPSGPPPGPPPGASGYGPPGPPPGAYGPAAGPSQASATTPSPPPSAPPSAPPGPGPSSFGPPIATTPAPH